MFYATVKFPLCFAQIALCNVPLIARTLFRLRILCAVGKTDRLLVNLELMKTGYPPIDIKFTDRMAYYNAFDAYHAKGNLSAMEKLFAGHINERLDQYLAMPQD